MKSALDQYWDDERRLTAFHEAGHASIFWFFQQRNFLHGVNMVGDERVDGFVRQSTITPLGYISGVVQTNPQRAEALATMVSMHALAGLCAEGIFGATDYPHDNLEWFQIPIDEIEIDNSLLEVAQSFEMGDLPQATRPAFELHGPNEPKIRAHLIKAARWTESALKFARMEQVVSSLAIELIPVCEAAGEMSGDTAWELMTAAWGNLKALPLYSKPWNRRFEALKSERWWQLPD